MQLPAGRYDVYAKASGYAESALYGVDISNQPDLNLRVYPQFYEGWPVAAPQAQLEVQQNRYRLKINTAAPFRVAYLAVGQEPGFPFAADRQQVFTEIPDTGWRSLEGLLADAAGEVLLNLLVYDQNNNRALVSVPVLHQPSLEPPPTELEPVTRLKVLAVTLPAEAYLMERGDQAAFQVVQLRWGSYRWPAAALGRPHGFYVWRTLPGGNEEYVGSYPPDAQSVFDRRLAGVWGEEITYRVVPYLSAEEGPAAEVSVTPLPPFTVSRLRPQAGETVNTTPEFSWEASSKVSENQFYYPLLWNVITGKEVFSVVAGGFTQKTHLSFNETHLKPLWPGRAYGFELNLAFAVDDRANPTAYSIALDRYGQLMGVPLAGEFNIFEVAP